MHKTLVTGSLAYDYIMNFPDQFKNHILPNKIHILSVAFLVDRLEKGMGGVAGNIAYNLNLLEHPCTLFSVIGKDSDDYQTWADNKKIDFSNVKIIPEKFTAQANIITDKDDNQITAFYMGAMENSLELSIKDLKEKPELVLVSTGYVPSMLKIMRECKEEKIPYVFDPGQQITVYTPEELEESIAGAEIIVVNDYEYQLIKDKTGFNKKDILEKVKLLVVTFGKRGSAFMTNQETIEIPAAPTDKVVDPTGCGDAFRGGLIYGFMNNFNLKKIGQIASLVAAYKIQVSGTQNHKFSFDEFKTRYKEIYAEEL